MGASIAKLQHQYLNSMLRRAVDRSDPRETEYYLRAGADPNAFNDTVPLLILAASKRQEVICNRLGCMSFAAHFAAATNWENSSELECCALLLDHGAAIDISTPHCPPALVLACKHYHLSAVRLLIERGAAVNVVHEVVKYSPGDWSSRHSITPLYEATIKACWSGSEDARAKGLEIMAFLLSRGADPNIPSHYFTYGFTNTCLGYALSWCGAPLNVTRLLLEHGADVELMHDGLTPVVQALHLSAAESTCSSFPSSEALRKYFEDAFDDQCRILEMLLSRGADIFRPVPNGCARRNGGATLTKLWNGCAGELCAPLTFVRTLETFCHPSHDSEFESEPEDPGPDVPIYNVHRRARINAIFDAFLLARCIVASRRYAYVSSARRRFFDHPYLSNEVAGFLGLKKNRC